MGSQLQAIVVGDSSDDFVRGASNLLESRGIDVVRCLEVYSSVPKLQGAIGGIVIGRFDELCKEDGRFFEIAQDYGFTCCCLVDTDFAVNRRELVEAMEQGVLLLTEAEQIEEALVDLSKQSTIGKRRNRRDNERGLVGNVVDTILGDASPKRPGARGKAGFSKGEFSMTQAELDALLGA